MAKAAERGHATRQRLFQAAVELIGEVGWSNVTTRLVAERAGVAPGVVHYHFGSVTELLVEASTAVAGEMLDGIAREVTALPGIGEGVDRLLGEMARYTGTDPASLLIAEMYLASARLPELRERLAGLLLDLRGRLAGWLREHGHPGDASAAATVLVAAVDGLVLHRGIDPGMDVAALGAPLRAMLTLREG
ncbi:TetR/AcrR family transcriptional regulator [Spongiactinospora sp. TRM90649]|uniref:TetR/AcrR family transcriptional regulator n=1 Tax=Spongiactinospora sp. TRM90649 TaxID=3031114 RepID=UPI0023F96F1B|nr:TetR/AcrR family transcriptional regulator [Spongiactinospora sp. TRM90649]MDF5759097.1 TetR family transcriptional regulator [Spongiactinospora sp. TRM90649]